MANNRLHGYTPKTVNEKDGNRLDKYNPYEFRRGMDYELTSMGVSRLAESTPDDREKATETVMKNLAEHGGYYTSLTTYEVAYRNLDKKPSFKQWLSEQDEFKMKEVEKEYKNDKMVDAKPNDLNTIKMKTIQPLKEAITKEVKSILSELKGKEAEKANKADAEKEKKDSKDSMTTAKGKDKKMKALDKEVSRLEKERETNKVKINPTLQKYKDGKMSADEYKSATKTLVDRNKEIVSRVKEIEKEKEEITLAEKMGRREVAKTMMEKDTHMEILGIMKEAGVNLREGAGGIKMYYEIAKTAYQEGFMAGLNKN
tara:strand:+ start:123 stop:1064 length:942 start_codon:yes stop_codon:yes gene_type:complete